MQKTRSDRMRQAGFVPRREPVEAENGDKIPSWGYTQARERYYEERQLAEQRGEPK